MIGHEQARRLPLYTLLDSYRVSMRAYNILRREEIRTISQFLALTTEEVWNWRNAGTTTTNEIAELQMAIRKAEQIGKPRPAMTKSDSESQTEFTVRIIQQESWWRGHDASCPEGAYCLTHENPYDKDRDARDADSVPS